VGWLVPRLRQPDVGNGVERMFHWAEEDGVTGQIVDKIMEAIDNEELNDLERIEEVYAIITKAHEEGII
jgi:hypothetical protein